MIPNLRAGVEPNTQSLEVALRFVTTPLASRLTGLSTEKLREWTRRRALVPDDVRPKQKGSPAKFSWQTILILRIAVLLRDQFGLELQSHKAFFANLRSELRTKSFITLWGHCLALGSAGGWEFLEGGVAAPDGDALLIHLDPHLAILRDGFELPDAAAARGQLDLFSLPAVHKKRPPAISGRSTAVAGRRRSM